MTELGTGVVPLRIKDDRTPRGGTVEMPLATSTSQVYVARTSGGGEGALAVDTALFSQVVENFPRRAGPVPVYFGHISEDERKRTPACGFVDRVWVESDQLWGLVDLGPDAWDAIVVQRGFRGFSVEIKKDLDTPTGSIPGWVLTGGAVTNTPALDVQYVAASETPDAPARPVWLHNPPRFQPGEETPTMEDKTNPTPDAPETASLEARLKADAALARAQGAEAKAALKAAEDLKADLEAKIAKLEGDNKKQRDELRSRETAALAAQVRTLVKDALDKGLAPAFVEGYDDDPANWCRSKFASADALAEFLDALPYSKGTVTASGRPPIAGEPTVTPAVAATIRGLGLDPRYALCATESEFRKIKETK